LTAVADATMFRVVSYADINGRPHVHAEPLRPAARNSSWRSGGNRLHSDDPAFADFTGGTDPIPLYDVRAHIPLHSDDFDQPIQANISWVVAGGWWR